MRTDVLFVTQDSAYPQMGVLYLMDALRQAGFESEWVASGIEDRVFQAVIETFDPKIIAMSVLTSPEIADFSRLAQVAKDLDPTIPVVWGGVHPTLLPQLCLQEPFVDHVFVGQCEESLPRFMKKLVDGAKLPQLVTSSAPQNLDRYSPAWDKDDIGRYLFSETHSVRSPDLRAKARPATSQQQVAKLLENGVIRPADLSPATHLSQAQMKKWDVGLYDSSKSIFYYLLTSRGCPFKCTFCSEPLRVMFGNDDGNFSWTSHSADWFRSQIDHIRSILSAADRPLDGVGIWDDMFWIRYKRDARAFQILEYLSGEGLGYLIEARADQLLRGGAELMHKLADTGCIQVFVGAESASQDTLDYMQKGTKVSDYYRLMDLANEVGVGLRMSFIVGFPEESERSVCETLDFCERADQGEFGRWVNISGPKMLTPYPGTVEYDRAIRNGFVPPSTNLEWGQIHTATEDYLERFPWFRQNYGLGTLDRLAVHFGNGSAAALRAH